MSQQIASIELPRDRPKPRRLVVWLGKLGLLASSLALALGACEAALRILHVEPQSATVLSTFLQYDRDTGWRGRPKAMSRFTTTNFDVNVTHDSDGFRQSLKSPIASDKDSASPIVWVLGDSGTWGWGVDDGKTYVDLLNRSSTDGTQYRNLGQCGYSTVQEYLLLKNLLAQGYKPRQVLVLFCQNDVFDNDEHSDNNPPRPHAGIRDDRVTITNWPVPASNKWGFSTWLKNNSIACNHVHFYLMRFKQAVLDRPSVPNEKGLTGARPSLAPPPVSAGLESPPEISTHKEWYTPERQLVLRHFYGLMRDLCREHDIEFAVISEFEVDVSLRTVCHELDVPLLDTSRRFRRFAASSESDQSWHFATDPHCNELGHRLLAEGIREELSRLRQGAGELAEKRETKLPLTVHR